VKQNNVPRTQVQAPGRMGVHGGEQGPWYGLGSIANRNQIPGAAAIGALTGYWTSAARLEISRRESFPYADGVYESILRQFDARGLGIHQMGARSTRVQRERRKWSMTCAITTRQRRTCRWRGGARRGTCRYRYCSRR
jgi:hypothetical protein